ncbi:MAG: aminoglycoside phosphotransferase family protein [Chitinophagaceae bacterium]|nr:aminoglycoside phosphotransferase family protein [Chitinophagaceae bacterium]
MKEILFQFGLSGEDFQAMPFGSGLINTTWKITDKQGNAKYILQKINQQIFKQPVDIAFNIRLIDNYLKDHFPDYLFVSPVVTITGDEFVKNDDSYYRMFPFITNSHTIDVVEKPQQAYEAARQFGKFTKLLSALDAAQLKITLPDFHNLTLRYQQFEIALERGNPERIMRSKDLIAMIKQNKRIADEYEICKEKFTVRVTHHDTKISNVLFDDADQGLCVIDLDTVMHGYSISDVGDMMRTYLCPVSEEEKDFSKIIIRAAFYEAIVAGYLSEMGAGLTEVEKQHIHFAGEFMIYMQAIRFLTDHLNNDSYYGAKYEEHNFVRAGNQIALLQRLQEFNKSCQSELVEDSL